MINLKFLDKSDLIVTWRLGSQPKQNFKSYGKSIYPIMYYNLFIGLGTLSLNEFWSHFQTKLFGFCFGSQMNSS